MAYEIERKFLLSSSTWRQQVVRTIPIQQAYLANTDKASLRIRIAGDKGYLSSKSMTRDIRRHEFEYEIPLPDAEFMIQHMSQGNRIIKDRHLVPFGHHTWEIDEFYGDNQGLLVAEVELAHETEAFARPAWLGKEVSNQERYFNMALIENPYKNWTT